MRKKIYLILTVVLSVSLSSVSQASASVNWRPVLVLTGGGAFSSDAGQSTYFPASPASFSYYDYVAKSDTTSSFLFGGLIGAEFMLSPNWLFQTGIVYYIPQTFDAEGVVTQGVDAASANQYAYQYSIQSSQLLLENKLLYHVQRFNPYFLIGIGVAWNRSEDFEVNIEPAFTAFSNQFPSKTITSFTYDIGVGLDVDLTEHARAGLGYRFTDFGKAETGKATIDDIATDNVLSQDHLYASEVLFQITLLY